VTVRPLVSVIIATHNRAGLLGRALESVFTQDRLGEQFDVEVIVVDDCSTDSTPDVVREYSQVRYLRLSTRRGVSGARNAGIEASRGAFICFLDDDDVWLPGRLKLQLPVFERHPEAGAVYSQVFHTQSGKAYPEPSRAVSGWIFEALLSGNRMCVHSVLIRREAFEKTGYFDESLSSYEDWDMWLRLSFHFPFVFVPGLVAVYLVSPRGLWQSGVGAAENRARLIARALEMVPDSPQYAGLKRAARARVALADCPTWVKVLETLRTYPWVLRHDWARRYVTLWIRHLALKSESPLSTLRELCAQMKAAAPDRRVRSRWGARQTVAKSWAAIACSLAVNPARQREAAYAAARAVTLAPSLLIRGALAPIIVRGIVASGVGGARRSEIT
jgi:glycosyltransferase involved in cell wall biosynthesis